MFRVKQQCTNPRTLRSKAVLKAICEEIMTERKVSFQVARFIFDCFPIKKKNELKDRHRLKLEAAQSKVT